MHPQFDHIASRVHEVISFMRITPEFLKYNLDWPDIEIKCVIKARRELTDQSMMTKGRLLDIIEEVVSDEIEIIIKENFTIEINDALVELLDEGKLRMLVNEEGELVYELNDDE